MVEVETFRRHTHRHTHTQTHHTHTHNKKRNDPHSQTTPKDTPQTFRATCSSSPSLVRAPRLRRDPRKEIGRANGFLVEPRDENRFPCRCMFLWRLMRSALNTHLLNLHGRGPMLACDIARRRRSRADDVGVRRGRGGSMRYGTVFMVRRRSGFLCPYMHVQPLNFHTIPLHIHLT